MPYYIFSIVALIILALLNFEIFMKKDSACKIKNYRAFIISVAIFFITDILWGVFYENKMKTPLYVGTFLYFVAMGVTVFVWSLFIIRYVNGNKIASYLLKIGSLIFVLIEITLLIITVYNPIFFKIDDNSIFYALTARAVVFYLQMFIYFCITIYSTIHNIVTKNKSVRRYVSIIIFCIMMIICIAFQVDRPLIAFYPIGLIIGVCILDTYTLNETKDEFKSAYNETNDKYQKNKEKLREALAIANIDPLTGVKSKYAYIEVVEHFDELINEERINEFAVLVFDINGLKLINDTEGHDAGDKYIIDSVNLIEKVFKDETVYRNGGDEFVIIITDELDNVSNNYNEFVEIIENTRKQFKVWQII